ncbi:hypothetical protein [Bacillus altitudinis]|uniref:hypothetical protein n=1 Tax=Bacillus altitudinis TaxID=293387 RepID=UPI000415B468|nr:hypothetical protein [Bacillus altitudinis]KIL28409.1 hypothetical protein B4133_0233 [Bacillus altitudinis]MCM3045750.1 hypothetical protein [Bacillus altitudinis]MCY7687585.1 hypothetical protein [Bacillus altitudinis]MCY7703064.1 hypothetical protein [Bacillus altitudinis]MDR4198854.1 hypothetical protein [Bacillus altitudinis]
MKKSFMLLLSIVFLVSMIPLNASASKNVSEDKTLSISVSEKDVKNTDVLIKAINELDANLNMKNLKEISQKELNKMTPETKKLYASIMSYKNKASSSLTGKDALVIFSQYVNELSSSNEKIMTTKGLGFNYKEYKISNSQINKLSKAVNLNSGFWATSTAIAKIFAKNPTALTLLLAAVPVLGIATLDACNSRGKGIIITKMGVGATNSYSCRSQ